MLHIDKRVTAYKVHSNTKEKAQTGLVLNVNFIMETFSGDKSRSIQVPRNSPE